MTGAGRVAVRQVNHDFVGANSVVPIAALRDIDLEVEGGSFVSIIGTSGCGKSTLLRIIAGLVQPTRGAVELDGERINGPDARKGLVFQQDAVFPWLTVKKNVEYGLRGRGLSRTECASRADQWIRLVGLTSFANAYPRELSGGMRKRVDLARVYANDPDILLMDEPFGALDAQTKDRMQEELVRLWEQRRKTVVFVTHDLDEAIFLSDRVCILSSRPGRVLDVEDVAFPRPRTPDLRLSEPFLDMKRRLSRHLAASELEPGGMAS